MLLATAGLIAHGIFSAGSWRQPEGDPEKEPGAVVAGLEVGLSETDDFLDTVGDCFFDGDSPEEPRGARASGAFSGGEPGKDAP